MTASVRQRTGVRTTTGWKLRRRDLESGLTVTAASVILLFVAPAVSIATLETNSSSCKGTDCAAADVGGSDERRHEVRNVYEHGGNGDTCFTAACNDTATMILNNMDRSVDPCDNFYRYACGGYLNSAKIPSDKGSVNSYTSTRIKFYEQLRARIEAEIEPNEPRAYKLVKKYYKSCLNETAIEARGVQPLLASLRRIGGWPIVEGASWNESNFDWAKAIYELRKTGHRFQDIINIEVDVNLLNSTEHAIYISRPYLQTGISKIPKSHHYMVWARYVYSVNDIAVKIGAPAAPNTRLQAGEAITFAFDLASMPVKQSTIISENTPMTLTELNRNYPSIPWQEYIRSMLPSTVPIGENQIVIVKTPTYFTRLEELMTNTSKRVLANYIGQSIALNSKQHLSQAMFQRNRWPETSPRWQMCINTVSSLSLAVQSMYASWHVSADTKSKVLSMVDGIRKALREMLETANWLDQNTKSKALQKLDAMYAYIAYPDQLSDDKLDKIYEKLEIDEDYYYGNVYNVSRFITDYSFGKLREPVDRNDMFGEIPLSYEVTTVYMSNKNVFAVTGGTLQDRFFGKDRQQYINYGTIGSLIGHEITHAFDGDGRLYNENGQLADWWQPSSEVEFIKRAQCIIDQYSNYNVQEVGLNVNGKLTRDENISDNGGMKGAYRAYNSWVAENGQEAKLPGLDMTPNQLFWMSAASFRCTRYKQYALIDRISKEAHSPDEFRVIGPMSNIPEFASDFACPVGSKMNPAKRCSVW